MTAAVLETLIPPTQVPDHASGAPIDTKTVDDAVSLDNTYDLAYSEVTEWRLVSADNLDYVPASWHALPAVVFLIVQAVLLVETVLALINLRGQAWQPAGVLTIALPVVGLSASFLAGAAVPRAE